jgi:hypothetical protein
MDGSFGKKIKDLILGSRGDSPISFKKNEIDFTDHLNALINSAQSEIVRKAWLVRHSKISSEAEFSECVTAKINTEAELNNSDFTKKIAEISGRLVKITDAYDKINDEIAQELKHDWASKIRFLLFRVLTTFGIAGAALAMAILANSLGYETAILKKKTDTPKIEEIIKQTKPSDTVKKVLNKKVKATQ